MGVNKIKLYFNTLRYLRFKQIFYRIFYLIKKLFKINYEKKINTHNKIKWINFLKYDNSFNYDELSFKFLNQQKKFIGIIDWNFAGFGKLWAFNLNYFDFLNQYKLSTESGLWLILNYIKFNKPVVGVEPYVISLRGINWIKFLSKNSISDNLINQKLYNDYYRLFHNIEYHLLANHLLENGFSLLFAPYYFQDKKFYKKSKKILESQLNEQILSDGAHFELSPMYHKIILFRLLDCISLIKLNNGLFEDNLCDFLESKAALMNSWLKNVTYINGETPMVNDSSYSIAPESKDLFNYFHKLNISKMLIPLKESGYRKYHNFNYELFVDIGNIGPDYQPGHAHSDTFSFELLKKNKAIIVDTGVSTYEKNSLRQHERSTKAHNTVQFKRIEQTQIWNGFRVANRAKVRVLNESESSITASHDGYSKYGLIHTRSFDYFPKKIFLRDYFNKSTNNNLKAYFHFHHNVKLPKITQNQIILDDHNIIFQFKGNSKIYLESYKLSTGYNNLKPASLVIVAFDKLLETEIYL